MLAIKAYVGKSKLNSANKNYIHLGLNLGTLVFHFNAFLTVLSQEGIKVERKSSLAQSSVEVMCFTKIFLLSPIKTRSPYQFQNFIVPSLFLHTFI